MASLVERWVALGSLQAPSLPPLGRSSRKLPWGLWQVLSVGEGGERLLLKDRDLLHSLTFLDLAFTTSGFYSKEAFCI